MSALAGRPKKRPEPPFDLKAELEKRGKCTKPDRGCPGLLCGYPLPCPHHTSVIDTTSDPPSVRLASQHKGDLALRDRLYEIGNKLAPDASEDE